jgi:hypothetical protein
MNAAIILRRFVLALCLTTTGLAVPVAHATAEEMPAIHVVAIGDLDVGMEVEDGKVVYSSFGIKVAEDAKDMLATFEKAFAKADKADQLKTHLILGEDVTPRHVLDVVGKVPVKANDTIVVLYSGHGQMEAGNRHVLTFHHGNLERQRLLDVMKAKNPRLMVLLTDCCSAGVAGRSTAKRYEPKAMKDGKVMEWSTVNSLFLRHSGLVDVTAAEPGFCGKIDLKKPGSLFTNALVRILKTPHSELIRNLDTDGDGQLQWDEILPQLRGLAAQYDRRQMDERAAQTGENVSDVIPQQASATSLGRWTPTR